MTSDPPIQPVAEPPSEPAMPASAAAEWIRDQLLSELRRACIEFAAAMRAEGISDEVSARVLNRIVTGVPDPDEVIRPADTEQRWRPV